MIDVVKRLLWETFSVLWRMLGRPVQTKPKKGQYDGISWILATAAILTTFTTKETWPIYFTSVVMSLPASRIGRGEEGKDELPVF